MTFIHECVQEVNDSNITVAERGRRANFLNPDRKTFRKVQVDGCLMASADGVRADWIISKVAVGSVVIELKGRDVEYACRQALHTLSNPVCRDWLEDQKAVLVVCSRYPAFNTLIARQEEAARKKRVRLKVVCDQGDFVIESLLGLRFGPACNPVTALPAEQSITKPTRRRRSR